MRLINATTFELQEFFADQLPEYVILSHTWDSEEVSFQDMQNPNAVKKAGFTKIRDCCAQAVKDGFEYAWIDTCCIDKTSSAELSEAINSMYHWYKDSQVCYAHLADVPTNRSHPAFELALRQSRWFTRGWTLQELIAPSIVEFYGEDWSEIGTKSSLQKTISEITGIESRVIRGDDPATCTVAQRMSWASKRSTTRVEDQAYCLLGLFQVNMPMLYGERESAFLRLQEEIMKLSEDYTLFAWAERPGFQRWSYRGLLASSPAEFVDSSDIILRSQSELPHFSQAPPYLTSRGLHITLPVKKGPGGLCLADLNCRAPSSDNKLCIYLKRLPFGSNIFGRVSSAEICHVRASEKFTNTALYVARINHELIPQKVRLGAADRLFSISTLPDGFSVTAICPESRWNFQNMNFLLVFCRTATAGVVLLQNKADYFLVVLGLREDQPWCEVMTDFEITSPEKRMAEQVYDVYNRMDDYLDSADRTCKPLRSGHLVYVAVRKQRSLEYAVHISVSPNQLNNTERRWILFSSI